MDSSSGVSAAQRNNIHLAKSAAKPATPAGPASKNLVGAAGELTTRLKNLKAGTTVAADPPQDRIVVRCGGSKAEISKAQKAMEQAGVTKDSSDALMGDSYKFGKFNVILDPGKGALDDSIPSPRKPDPSYDVFDA